MQQLGRVGLIMAIFGLLLFLPCGGMRIKGDAEGTWLFLGPLQWAGAAANALGLTLALIGSFAGRKGATAKRDSQADSSRTKASDRRMKFPRQFFHASL